ncbi:MAG: T9SS type A sorting domain-containing protein [Bacteroidetes bacterium]|nr:T9SS type A sorting domain-containing protein [Bacteroidota bacterium]
MKKIATTLFLISSVILGYSQNIVLLDDNHNVISNTTIDISVDSSTNTAKEILVKNAGSIADTIKVVRTIYSVDGDDQTQFCWGGLCYLFSTNISSLSLTIAAGDTVDFAENGFHAIFNSGTNCVTRLVHYKFYNIHNFSDSTGITLRYLCSTGVNELKKVGGNISSAYPNPSNSLVSFKYDLKEFSEKGVIKFYNMLGKTVKEVVLTDKQGVTKINVLDLDAGIYFYSFIVDDKIISTKKMVINRED